MEKWEKEGKGTYIYTFGGKYIGDWVNDKKHGEGFSIDEQGNSYKGDFLDGEMKVKVHTHLKVVIHMWVHL